MEKANYVYNIWQRLTGHRFTHLVYTSVDSIDVVIHKIVKLYFIINCIEVVKSFFTSNVRRTFCEEKGDNTFDDYYINFNIYLFAAFFMRFHVLLNILHRLHISSV